MRPSAVCLAIAFLGFAAVRAEAPDRFYEAIRNNDLAALRVLAKTAGVNSPDKRGTTPLMNAAAFGSTEAMNILVDESASVNAANNAGATALMWCAGDLEKTRLLLAHGADINAKSKHGRTAARPCS